MANARVTKSSVGFNQEQLALFQPDCGELQRDAERGMVSAAPTAPARGIDVSRPAAESIARQGESQAKSARPHQAITTPAPDPSARPPKAAARVDDNEQGGVYLQVKDVAERLRCSTRTIHELTRTCAIPHRRLPGTRRCLFREEELEAWESGSALEVTELPRGGRLVRPRPSAA